MYAVKCAYTGVTQTSMYNVYIYIRVCVKIQIVGECMMHIFLTVTIVLKQDRLI
jgi:hypothetical protein